MKQEDFDRLKAVCEKEGFEIGFKYDESTYTVRLKKDIWEGVEFVDRQTSKVPICRLSRTNGEMVWYYNSANDEVCWPKFSIKPSTESAYVEQLKAEAFKRFGEIKEGDRFDRRLIKTYWESDTKIPNSEDYKGWHYRNNLDQLFFNGLCLYCEGKWANRVKEKVKVEWASTSCDTIRFNYGNSKDVNLVKDGPILAKLIEDYLNKD